MPLSEITIEVAGVGFRLRGDWAPIRAAARRYSPYRRSGQADLVVDWRIGTPPRARHWPFPFVSRDDQGTLTISRRDFQGETRGTRCALVTGKSPMALDTFLRIVVSEMLIERGGLLVHAASLGGRLFPGKSGAGKSTLASLAPRRRVLSDEVSAVVPAPRGFFLCGTPFWGSFVRGTNRERNPLRAIYVLKRRKREEIRALDKAEAAMRLLECALGFREDDEQNRRLLEIAARVVSAVPCFALSYDARSMVWRELNERLRRCEASDS